MAEMKLQPCPFCGSHSLSIRTHMSCCGTVEVECENCTMKFEYEEDYKEDVLINPIHPDIEYHTRCYHKTKPTFIEAWNRRVDK